ncbi:SDR family NAD(P)-dependent oxidoreductase [Nocardiopsis lambiniae]|uniref:SDR family NAD(P)-dependent oxidoreductase n=1 Tax=Nocardiopsis lambiniae TaxID=3075539 RepID=A0ABU2M2T1_9ACTN|nr:SDR family NAD(P)-dependent oxidoreductase [Nocardiopsis sp. DSM 44743]MDT0326907.1 SDR family NAD(P)-dependent oxidoreductase [Nocardiopsis sp. DSM 44743]
MSETNLRIALVSGANKGIGFQSARLSGPKGMTLPVGSRDIGRGTGAVRALEKEGVDARPLEVDVTDRTDVRAARAPGGGRVQ